MTSRARTMRRPLLGRMAAAAIGSNRPTTATKRGTAVLTTSQNTGMRLAMVSVWRLVIAVLATVGLLLYLHGDPENLCFFTQQSNLLVAVFFTGMVVYPVLSWGRRL